MPSGVLMWVLLGVMVLLIIGSWFLNNRRYKKQQQEREEKMNSLRIGDTIVTIGMLVGEIVEILDDGNYVLKTGNGENVGYITVQPNAIYQMLKKEQPVDFDAPSATDGALSDTIFEEESNDKAEEEKTSSDVLTETVGNVDEMQSEEVENG